MQRRVRDFRADTRGVAALEFAITASALMLLLLGSIGAGLLWWTENGLQTVATLTARCAGLGSCSDPAAFAIGVAGSWIGASAISAGNVVVTTGSACYGATGGYDKFVKVTISSAMWTAVLPAPLANITLSASACFPVSQLP